jgi:hypothetical protein
LSGFTMSGQPFRITEKLEGLLCVQKTDLGVKEICIYGQHKFYMRIWLVKTFLTF